MFSTQWDLTLLQTSGAPKPLIPPCGARFPQVFPALVLHTLSVTSYPLLLPWLMVTAFVFS